MPKPLTMFSSVTQSCPTLCDPMNHSMPGLPVHHQLPDSTQTHVHWVGDAIQPSHPLSSPSPPALNLSQHQGLFKWVSPLHQVAKVLELQIQHQSFQWTPRTDCFRMYWLNPLQSKGFSRVFSNTTVQKHQFFTTQLSLFFRYLLVYSVQFSRSVVSNSLRPHEPQHASPPCPSPTAGAYPNPCSLSWWCHPTISFSLVPFSSCLLSFPASGSFQMNQLFASSGQSIGVSASRVLPMNTQDWFPLAWTSWISLQSKELSRVFSNTSVQKHQFFCTQLSL